MSITLVLMMAALILTLMLMLISILTPKPSPEMEKMSPFECGFAPTKMKRNIFSLQMFFIALLFLIFDVELAILFPALSNNLFVMNKSYILLSMAFLLVLLLGLIFEWSQKALDWVI